MKAKKPLHFFSFGGRTIFAITDSKKWFWEFPFNELPDDFKNQVLEVIEKAENLKNLLDWLFYTVIPKVLVLFFRAKPELPQAVRFRGYK